MKKSGLYSRLLAATITIAALIGTAPCNSLGQQKEAASDAELLKSIGLRKPTMSSAPDFNLLDTNGRPISLSGYRGQWVLLNFWATWCGPCKEEMPSMEELSRSLSGQLAVVAVNQRENAALVNKFMKTQGLNFPTPLDTNGRVAGYYRVYGIPVTYLIDAGGQAVGMKSGPMDWAAPAVIAAFRKLIGAAGNAGGSIDLEPAKPLPAALRAKTEGVVLRAQQDTLAEAIGKVSRGDELVPLGKVSGAGEFWYMVKTGRGVTGWVRGGDVEEVNR